MGIDAVRDALASGELPSDKKGKSKSMPMVYLGEGSFGLVSQCVSTQIPLLDRILAKDINGQWGLPLGRSVFIAGKPSCLSGNTEILIKIGRNGGRYYTLEDAYYKFNHIERHKPTSKSQINRFWNKNYIISIPSLLNDGTINNSPIKSIVKSGKKKTYILMTQKGRTLRATKLHRLKVPWIDNRVDNEGFVELQNLKIGDEIICKQLGLPLKIGQHKRNFKGQKTITVKYHPNGCERIRFGIYKYKEISYSLAVYEAAINKLSLKEYIYILRKNALKASKLKYLNKGIHIHHKNGDYNDHNPRNLRVKNAIEHGVVHSIKDKIKKRFSNQVPEIDKVKSIEFYGYEDTYDIVMGGKNPNFVANEFVVHNSGKTTLSLHLCAEVQAKGGLAIYIDGERKLDRLYATRLKVAVDDLILGEPYSLEDILEIVKHRLAMIRKMKTTKEFSEHLNNLPIIIVVDSTSIATRAEREVGSGSGGKGEHARLLSKFFRDVIPDVKDLNVLLVFVCQIKSKIQMGWHGGHGNQETFLGEEAIRFQSTIGLRTQRIKIVKDSDGDRIGDVVLFRTVKNQVANPMQECEVDLYYGKGLDRYGSLCDMLVNFYGAKKKQGGNYELKKLNLSWKGRLGLKRLFKNDPKVEEEINKLISTPVRIKVP